VPDAPDADIETVGAQQRTFHWQVAAVPSQRAAGAHHTVTWHGWVVTVAHDVADRAPCAWSPGQSG